MIRLVFSKSAPPPKPRSRRQRNANAQEYRANSAIIAVYCAPNTVGTVDLRRACYYGVGGLLFGAQIVFRDHLPLTVFPRSLQELMQQVAWYGVECVITADGLFRTPAAIAKHCTFAQIAGLT